MKNLSFCNVHTDVLIASRQEEAEEEEAHEGVEEEEYHIKGKRSI